MLIALQTLALRFPTSTQRGKRGLLLVHGFGALIQLRVPTIQIRFLLCQLIRVPLMVITASGQLERLRLKLAGVPFELLRAAVGVVSPFLKLLAPFFERCRQAMELDEIVLVLTFALFQSLKAFPDGPLALLLLHSKSIFVPLEFLLTIVKCATAIAHFQFGNRDALIRGPKVLVALIQV